MVNKKVDLTTLLAEQMNIAENAKNDNVVLQERITSLVSEMDALRDKNQQMVVTKEIAERLHEARIKEISAELEAKFKAELAAKDSEIKQLKMEIVRLNESLLNTGNRSISGFEASYRSGGKEAALRYCKDWQRELEAENRMVVDKFKRGVMNTTAYNEKRIELNSSTSDLNACIAKTNSMK